MRFIYIIGILSLLSCENKSNSKSLKMADNIVVAHRGAWKAKDLPQNSIASLRHAIKLNCAGSEFDVHMTADDVLIVTHDSDYNDLNIEESNYADLNTRKLENGEDLPTLKAMLKEGMINNPGTGLVCEIKPTKSKERGQLIATKVMELVKSLNAESFVTAYISFDYNILRTLVGLDSTVNTQFLDGSKSPEALKSDGISGLDYNYNVFKKKPEWIQSAKDLGLVLNAWTVNNIVDMDLLIASDFDFITTDEPELLFARIERDKK